MQLMKGVVCGDVPRVLSLAAALVLGGAACAVGSGAEGSQPTNPQQPSVVANVGDATVSLAEVDAKALELDASEFRGMTLGQALFEARQIALDEIIADTLLETEAKRQGLARDAYVTREATGSLPAVSDAEVDKWYRDNASRVGGQPFETVKEPIRTLLTQVRERAAVDTLVARLRSNTTVTTHLEPPRTQIEVGPNDPVWGPAQAAVEIVEFSDFQCPFCQSVGPTLKQLQETYGDKIRLVYKDLPLENHPNAPKAAEAGNCAQDQGKFWALHDVMFAKQRELGVDQLKQHAAGVGLDAAAFNACLDSGKHAAAVQADAELARQYGVTATPTFFINGRLIAGAQPLESFKRVIDDELARRKK